MGEQKANPRPLDSLCPQEDRVTASPHGLVAPWASPERGMEAAPDTLEIVQNALGALAARYRYDEVLTAVRRIPARPAQFRPLPAWVNSQLAAAYGANGIEQLYSHQAAAAALAHAGKNLVVVTPTASG